jgi:hypothetical protein
MTGVQVLGGEPPFGATLVGHWDGYAGSYADVWGDGNYAYVGHFGQQCVNILDISNPSNPTWVADVCADPPNDDASAQDVKAGDGLLFIALESNPGDDNVLVVDVRDPANPVKKTLITVIPTDIHNMFYHNGYLYLADSSTPQVAIVDLTNYDPDNAPATITTPLWILTNVGTSFVHDVNVQDVVDPQLGYQGTRLYVSAWNSGLWVYDGTDVATESPTFLGSAPGTSTHSCWATDDGKWVVTAEERSGGGIKTFEITPNGGSLTLTLRDSYSPPLSVAFSVHNPLIVGNRIYNAWYQWGAAVFDMNTTTGELTLVANYDTFPDAVAGYDGMWGIYPFLGSDKVLASDIEYGFFILNITGAAYISLPFGLPEYVHPVQGTAVTVEVIDGPQPVDPKSVTLHATIDANPTADVPMAPLGGGLYQADLPPTPCGSSVSFYFSAETITRALIRNPIDTGEQYVLNPTTGSCENLRHDFETDSGWTTICPAGVTGCWVRGDPNGTVAQPEDDNPNGVGTQCFFTGQAAPGAPAGTNDVDGGSTTLTSPSFDGTAPNLHVGYARWYSNNAGGGPGEDQMNVDISNNGGALWVPLEVVTENANAWVEKLFRIGDVIAPTNNMRVRFIASDLGAGSLVEAAIDDFVLTEVVCSDPPGNTGGDADMDLADYVGFDDCMTGPAGGAMEGCCSYDTDGDDDVDMDDYLAVHLGFTGPA